MSDFVFEPPRNTKIRTWNQPVRIRAFSNYIPRKEGVSYSNADLLRLAGVDSEKIEALASRLRRRFGQDRRVLLRNPHQPHQENLPRSEDLVVEGLKPFFESNEWGTRPNHGTPDAFVLGSTTSARYSGSQAAAVMGRLGLNCTCFELKAGCATSLATLELAFALQKSGLRDVLVACGETPSKLMDMANPESWFALADGAAALWLESAELDVDSSPSPTYVFERSISYTDGRFADLFTVPVQLPPSAPIAPADFCLRGNGQALFDLAFNHYLHMIRKLLPSPEERSTIRWVVPHQINLELIQKVLKHAEFSEKTELVWNAREQGCFAGAAVLSSFTQLLSSDQIQPGEKILLMAVGGGLHCAAHLWRRRT